MKIMVENDEKINRILKNKKKMCFSVFLSSSLTSKYIAIGVLQLLEIKRANRDYSIRGRRCASGRRRELLRQLYRRI